MNPEKLAKSTTTSGAPPEPGYEDGSAPGPVDPATGMHTHYWVLSEEERAKGFVRPVRRSYRHVGPAGPKYPLRDCTAGELDQYAAFGYIKFEPYLGSELLVTGRYWTQAQLDKVGKGCGTTTTMGLALCETYARDPSYYGNTFCVACKTHLPVEEFVWSEDGERLGT